MDSVQAKLSPLYKTYNEVIKPLIAEIEARTEHFPTSLYNEIRAFTDHVARCHKEDVTDADVDIQISKAKGHIDRIVFDCYKFLNVYLFDVVVAKFDKRTKNIDLSLIDNGRFYIKYRELRQSIIDTLKEAKSLETRTNKEASLDKYQLAHNIYDDLEQHIIANDTNICWAKVKYTSSKFLRFLGWIGSAIISGIISSSIIPWSIWWDYIKSLF